MNKDLQEMHDFIIQQINERQTEIREIKGHLLGLGTALNKVKIVMSRNKEDISDEN